MFDHCLYFNTTALARRLEREWAQAFAPFGLTPPQAFMLRMILDRPGMLQRELAEALAISRPTATRALDGLEDKRLVERRDSDGDGREWRIHPGAKAVAMKAALNAASAAVTERLKRQLGTSAFQETVTRLRELRGTLA
jgi:DNA-binding MarR family transcriptional regulator